MKPILYPQGETEYSNNGLGVLADAVSCLVTEERNGAYELEMQYPSTGIHYDDIALRTQILAKPNPTDQPQPFRVYRVSKPMKGVVTVYAQHISYDLSGAPVSPFTAESAPDALRALKQNAAVPHDFTFWTDKETVANMKVTAPISTRALLGGIQGSILDVYGGEYEFDRFTVKLYNQRGTDRGVTVRYGKNLTSLEQEENCANVYTGVYPYWTDIDGNLVQLPEKIVNAEGTFGFTRIMPLDFSTQWQEAPTDEQLRNRAVSYMAANNIGIPSISLDVSFVQLEQTEEYKDIALLERVDLCDTVRVGFPEMGVSAAAKVTKTVYDVLRDRYKSVHLGDARYTIADTVANQQQEAKATAQENKNLVQAAMDKMNAMVQNASGMFSTDEKQPDGSTIHYLHDKKTLLESTNVIKVTSEAIGFSTDGGKTYPFGLAINGDVVANILNAIGINANWINAGTLNASLVKIINLIADHVNSVSGDYSMELWAAIFSLFDKDKYRVRIYTTDNSAGTNAGIVQVFSGNVTDNGMQDDRARYSFLGPGGLGVGENRNGAYDGTIHCGSIYAYDGTVNCGDVYSKNVHFSEDLYAAGATPVMKQTNNGVELSVQKATIGMYSAEFNDCYWRDLTINGNVYKVLTRA